MIRDEKRGEFLPQCQARFVAKMTGIGISLIVRNVIFLDQRGRATIQQWSANGMFVSTIGLANLVERSLEYVTDDNPLTDMYIAKRVEVSPPRVT